jgi:hypothetical protein
MSSLERQRVQEIDELKLALGQSISTDEYDSANTARSAGNANGSGSTVSSSVGSSGGNVLTENKIAYLRQMVIRYLSCKDPVVRPHIESALVAMLRVSPEERTSIEERQKDETGDANSSYSLSSISNFLGSLGV